MEYASIPSSRRAVFTELLSSHPRTIDLDDVDAGDVGLSSGAIRPGADAPLRAELGVFSVAILDAEHFTVGLEDSIEDGGGSVVVAVVT